MWMRWRSEGEIHDERSVVNIRDDGVKRWEGDLLNAMFTSFTPRGLQGLMRFRIMLPVWSRFYI